MLLARVSTAGIAMAVIAWVLLGSAPPTARPADAPLQSFSAERALAHLRHIAAQPRPIGSAHHEAVRAYLASRMRELGWHTEIQTGTVAVARESEKLDAATVYNVVARLPGESDAQAVLVVGHYDSVPSGPGASDNGAAVAAMLEVARALATDPPLRHDVVLLFSDAEEVGLMGAQAFDELHPLARRVAMVLNFEARGVSGPSRMFETGHPNAASIKLFARAAPHPSATSVAPTLFEFLPHDTDFSVFAGARRNGFNFAYIGDAAFYHAAVDDVAHLDLASLQHHGDTMLALVRELGNAEIAPLLEPDGGAVYFDVLGAWLVHYPSSWALPLAAFASLLVLANFVQSVRRNHVRLSRVVLGVAWLLLALLVAPLVVGSIWLLVRSLHPVYSAWFYWDTYDSALYQAGFASLAVAATTAVAALGRRWLTRAEIAAAAGCIAVTLAVVTAIWLPGASYLFLLALPPALVGLVLAHPSGRRGAWGLHWVLGLLVLPALFAWVPIVHGVGQILTVQLGAISAAVLGLGLILFLPAALAMAPKPLLPVVLPGAVAGILLVAIASALAGFDEHHPKPNGIIHLEDADIASAFWITEANTVDDWNRTLFAHEPPGVDISRYMSWIDASTIAIGVAPVRSLPAPDVTLLRNQAHDGQRTIEMTVIPRGASQLLELRLEPSVQPLRWSIAGRSITPATPEQGRLVQYWQPLPGGVHITLTVAGDAPVRLRIVDYVFGLPEGMLPRGHDMMTSPFGLGVSDATAVTRSIPL